MAPRLNDLIPMLICRDVQRSIRFYCDVLGFEVSSRMDDVGRSGWASLQQGQVALMLASPTYLPEAPKVDGRYPQVVYYFYPDDVAEFYEHVRASGGEAGELRTASYGMREFEMTDPDGHLLWFGQKEDESLGPDSPE